MRRGCKIFDADTHLNPMALARKPSEYITSGRFFANVVIDEGEKMVGRVTEFLGDGVLMYSSNYLLAGARMEAAGKRGHAE